MRADRDIAIRSQSLAAAVEIAIDDAATARDTASLDRISLYFTSLAYAANHRSEAVRSLLHDGSVNQARDEERMSKEAISRARAVYSGDETTP